jgi:hypothetical protein
MNYAALRTTNPVTHRRSTRRSIALSGLSAITLALSLSGCGLGTVQLSGPSAEAVPSSGISGILHGGDQPIVGATVTLYQVGTSGYGTGASAIAGATTTTGAGGSFKIPSYTCPSSTTLVYLVATGGNPGLSATDSVTAETVSTTGTAGTNTVLFTGNNDFHVGQSVTLAGFTAFSYLNGTQTVTAVAPTQGGGPNTSFSIADTSSSDPGAGSYSDTGTVSGTSATNANLKIVAPIGQCSGAAATNVFLNEVVDAAAAFSLAQYADPATGQIGSPSTTLAQTGLANAFNTFTNLVTLSNGTANAGSTKTANGFTISIAPENLKLNTVADILAACINSSGGAEGDGSICGTLFANVGTTSYPTDTFGAAVDMALNPTSTTGQIKNLYGLISTTPPFTGVSVQPTDWTVGILYTDTTTNSPVLTQPQSIAIDASGNVWVASDGSSVNGALGELSPVGSPLVGTNSLASTAFGALNPRNVAVDPSGNVWLTTSSSNGDVFEYTPGTASAAVLALSKSSYGIAIDGSGNVFVGHESSSDTVAITEIPSGSSLVAASEISYPLDSVSGTNILRPEYLAFDPYGNLWSSDGSDTTPATQPYTIIELSGITPCTPTPCTVTQSSSANVYTNVSTASGGTGSPNGAYGMAGAGIGGTASTYGIWWANKGGNDLSMLTVSSTGTVANGTGAPFGTSSTFSGPRSVAVDGAGNVWSPNGGSSSPNDGIQEYNATGTVLSPTNARGYVHAGLSAATGIAIDPSGNVWVANNVSYPPSSNTDGASVFELVGAAAPTIAPLSAGLGALIGTKP